MWSWLDSAPHCPLQSNSLSIHCSGSQCTLTQVYAHTHPHVYAHTHRCTLMLTLTDTHVCALTLTPTHRCTFPLTLTHLRLLEAKGDDRSEWVEGQ